MNSKHGLRGRDARGQQRAEKEFHRQFERRQKAEKQKTEARQNEPRVATAGGDRTSADRRP